MAPRHRIRLAVRPSWAVHCECRSDWYLVRVEITVTDVNDNVPEWSMAPVPYLAVVSPEAVPGSLVYQLLARDDDGGDNGEVEFFLFR
ncbi:hypothetical protein NHX12_005260 [Muraenolepis orangiensis]|uniref:Cadherin domain-containing protein n=1 Tax=Muraenolepis orangiensis TaxID=630683 RepID=A0A9Q0DUP5_9TELE|nr:hypothetical protein NHX12_005260 [Muraenolepis orangiensis]